MGASAARHLSMDPEAGSVVVVGPDEATDRHTTGGPFGAWHDEARLTRVIADDDVWAGLAAASIARYPQIEAEGGLPFHRTQGVIYVHEGSAGFERQLDVASRHGAVFAVTTPADHPYLRMEPGTRVIAERGAAGTVNPRALVQNQLVSASRRGARIVRDHVVGMEVAADRVRVWTAGGSELAAERVVVAAGAYMRMFDLVSNALSSAAPVAVGITALFWRVDGDAAAVLADMPGILWHEDGDQHWLYSVPPTLYPDGTTWFKIGGYRDSGPLATVAEIDRWHLADGSEKESAFLRSWVTEHIPSLAGRDAHSVGCVITETATTYPIIREVAPRVVVATGCGGAAAKSCDEIGRLAAGLSTHGRWDSQLDQSLFDG